LKFCDQDRKIQAVAAVRKMQMGFKNAQKMLKRCVNMKGKAPEEAVLIKSRRRLVSCFSRRYGTGVSRIPTCDGTGIFWPQKTRYQNDGFPNI
jgi:hypothetical protein